MQFRYRFLGLLLAVFAGLISPRALAQSNAESHLQRGLDQAHAGQLGGAEAELRQATQLAPRNSDAWGALGTVLAMQHKLPESTEAFRQAVKFDSTNLTTRRYLAANLWQLHQYSEAKTNLQIILKTKPDDAAAKLLLGMVSENSGDYAAAVRMLSSVPEEVHKQPESIAALARSYYHLQQKEKARTTLSQLSLAGTQATFLGAQIADEMQDFETARSLLGSIRTTYPDHIKLESTLALVAYHTGQYAECENLLQGLVASGNQTASVSNLQGLCYQKQGKSAEAVESLKQAISSAPTEEINYLDLTRILVEQRLLPRALEVAKHTTEIFPNSADAYELRGSIEIGMSQFTDAIDSYKHASQIDPSHPNGLLGLAQAQASAGLTKEAFSSFEAGSKKFPKDARFKNSFAAVLLKQADNGDTQAEVHANQLLREALTLDPSLSDAHYQLGSLDLKHDRVIEAEKHFEEVTRLDPNNAQGHFALARVYRRFGRQEDATREMKRYEELKGADSQ